MRRRLPAWAMCLFFIAVLALGLLTAADYGPTWDEQDEMDILRMNLWEYARALGLDQTAFTARAARSDTLTISTLTPISQSIEQDHGAALFYPMAPVVMSDTLSDAAQSALWHMWCWIIFTLGTLGLYGACRQLGLSRAWALLAPTSLLLSPRFFAQGHFNNKDIALMAVAAWLLWHALALLRDPSPARAAMLGLAGALAANTKVAGAALFGLCALAVLAHHVLRRSMNRRAWLAAAVAALCFAAGYALLTPALWADPAAFVRYLVRNALAFSRWQNLVLFRGAVFDLSRVALPRYYLPYMILATTPLWMLALAGAGSVWAACAGVRRLRTGEGTGLVLCVLMWLLPLGFAVFSGTHVYNGWRHFYFVYAPLTALAAWGAHRIWHALRTRASMRRVAAGLLGVCMLLSAAGIVSQHPHQQAYYQPLVQLRGTDYNELDYWNVSARSALQKLAAQHEGTLHVAAADLWSRDALSKALLAMPQQQRARFSVEEDAAQARYVLVNPTYRLFSGAGLPPQQATVALTSYGQCIMYLYENPPKGADEP